MNVFIASGIALITNKFIVHKVSLTDSDGTQYNHFDDDGRIHRPLRLKKKFYEFYTAPITKFWADSVSC